MEKSIFYSWQSDLPNSKNRGFIQDCIELAIKELQKERLYLEVAVDRDTLGVIGTPDITSTIFSKIDNTHIFIADISLVNPDYPGKKTPNPNVLIELGYAAKLIGWDHVICIFNKEFGNVEELPFDLRFRRPIVYKIENPKNKTIDKKLLAGQIKHAISAIINKQSARDEIRYYIKQNIDKDILSIANQLFKICYDYDKQLSSENIWTLLLLTQQEVQEQLFEKRFLGFTVLKEWEGNLRHLQETINKPFFVQHAEQPVVNAVLKVIKALESMTSITKAGNLFIDSGIRASGYKAVYGPEMNPDNPKDHFILLKEIGGEKGIVIDSGEIKSFNSERILTYQHVKAEKFMSFAITVHILIASLNNWTKTTGKSFIIGPSYT